jgi:hypothetical protein
MPPSPPAIIIFPFRSSPIRILGIGQAYAPKKALQHDSLCTLAETKQIELRESD